MRTALAALVGWPAAQLAKQQAALVERQQLVWRRLLRLPQLVSSAIDTPVGTTPYDVVLEMGTLSLRCYRSKAATRACEPVLFCYALINRPYILDLQPEKSVLRQYLDRGFDVYLIDWGIPSHADHRLTLEDYVERLLASVVDFILSRHEVRDLHLLGYCMGGTLSALYTALHPRQIKTLTLLAAPIDFSGQESLLNAWTDPRYFDVDAFVDAYGNCPAAFLQVCFLGTKPIQNLLTKSLTLYEQMEDPRFVSNYFAMERWVNDNIPVAGETFREFVKKLYQGNQLVRGELQLGAQRVELGQIACPLLLLTAQKDHLVPPDSTLRIRSLVSSPDVEALAIDAGHVGLVVGGRAHATLWPRAVRWLAQRSSPPTSDGSTDGITVRAVGSGLIEPVTT